MFDQPESFSMLTDSIGRDFQFLSFHWQLLDELESAVGDLGGDANRATSFWRFSLAGHHEAVLFRLCRIFDQHANTLNLKNWLVALRDYPSHFALGNNAPSDLGADIESASATDSVVNKIVRLRNNFLAHKALSPITDPQIAAENMTLTNNDIQAAIDRAEELINKYCRLLNRPVFSTMFTGARECREVFEAYRKGIADG